MATIQTIEFDFKQANIHANRLEELANSLSGLSNNQLKTTLQGVSTSWKGENASMYIGKGAKLQYEVDQTSRELLAIATQIRQVAKKIYIAEMEAVDIAQN